LKKCTKCGEWKDESEFSLRYSVTSKPSLRNECKSCLSSQERNRVNNNREAYNQRRREKYQNSHEHYAKQQRERRSKRLENEPGYKEKLNEQKRKQRAIYRSDELRIRTAKARFYLRRMLPEGMEPSPELVKVKTSQLMLLHEISQTKEEQG
jgi:hypothetical protein